MTNYEKHKELVLESIKFANTCKLGEKVFDTSECSNRTCSDCRQRIINWLKEEYVPQIDWTKVPVDTPVMWKTSSTTEREVRRYFAYVVGDMPAIYEEGRPSWTATSIFTVEPSKLRLAFQDDIEKYSI
jgi:hypothetical protein